MVNPEVMEKLETWKENFLKYINSIKSKDSIMFDKYTEMNTMELLDEFNKQRHMIESNKVMFICLFCTDLGIDMNSDETIYSTLSQYIDLFCKVTEIMYK